MKQRFAYIIALCSLLFCFSSTTFALVEGFFDYVHIKVPPRAQFLDVSDPTGVAIFPGSCVTDTCYLLIRQVKWYSGDVMVTIGEDLKHSCQLIFKDGKRMSHPKLSKKPICNGGYTCDGKLKHKYKGHTYTIEIRGPHLAGTSPEDEQNEDATDQTA